MESISMQSAMDDMKSGLLSPDESTQIHLMLNLVMCSDKEKHIVRIAKYLKHKGYLDSQMNPTPLAYTLPNYIEF
jgi:Tfp pilus assembly protein PilF